MSESSRTPGTTGDGGGKFSLTARQIVIIVVVVIAGIFIGQNRSRVRIHFFSADFTCPMWLLLVIMTVIGILLGFGISKWRRHTKEKR